MLQLYSADISPFAARVRIAIYFKQLPFEDLGLPRGSFKSAEFLAINPMGKIPGLLLADGRAIVESRPVAGLAAVTAAAAAVESLAKTLALELAPLRFNVVSPGCIDTPMYTAIFGEQRTSALAAQAAKLPGKRVGTAAEAAHAVLLLMCNDYINASVLHVDGGMRLV
jgi:NAD(P)-dependent dehydrogenase (short-subunit alcohol dehydrogenase family)